MPEWEFERRGGSCTLAEEKATGRRSYCGYDRDGIAHLVKPAMLVMLGAASL